MNRYVWDCETDGLLNEMTKIHVISWYNLGTKESGFTHDYEEMREFITGADELVCHNQIRFDTVVVQKLLGIKIKARLIDTLGLSWYINHTRMKHGLESYGEEYGVSKPVIKDWDNLTPEEYAHKRTRGATVEIRCTKGTSSLRRD